jgi:hypothetical protein
MASSRAFAEDKAIFVMPDTPKALSGLQRKAQSRAIGVNTSLPRGLRHNGKSPHG